MAIKLLIVDDSAFVRQILRKIIEKDSDIVIIGEAENPYVAREIIAKNKPDVITLDIEMPKMDGLTFLKKLSKYFPIPTIIVSSLSKKNSQKVIEAFEAGAIDVLEKPRSYQLDKFNEMAYIIVEKIKAAASSKNKKTFQFTKVESQKEENTNFNYNKNLFIGASTGGPEAVYNVVSKLPKDYLGTVVVIHMPEGFTKSYAERLDKICNMRVKEAEDGDEIKKGWIYIAPGNYQLYIRKKVGKNYIEIKQDPIYKYHRPSVDLMFFSVAEQIGKNAIGLILTGMGKDGAEGMKKMKNKNSYNIAQNENSCIVYGMPRAAVEEGAIDKIMGINEIPVELIKKASER